MADYEVVPYRSDDEKGMVGEPMHVNVSPSTELAFLKMKEVCVTSLQHAMIDRNGLGIIAFFRDRSNLRCRIKQIQKYSGIFFTTQSSVETIIEIE
jgi:hypothetical protein